MSNEPDLELPAPENARSPMKTWRILFLDNADHVEMLKGACSEEGYVVVGATVIEEAWSFLEGEDHADVIVCAAHLEEESMFDFLIRVRRSETHRNAMFLILALEPGPAGLSLNRSTKSAGLALGADTYLVMPIFDAPGLIAAIRKLQPSVPMLQQAVSEEEKRRAR